MKLTGLAIVCLAFAPSLAAAHPSEPAPAEAVVAGHATGAIIQLVPVPAKVGSYPPGTVIVPGDGIVTGGELRAFAGGFRAWFEFQVGGWGTTFDDPGTVQARFDGSGFLDADTSDPGSDPTDDGDQPDLVPPSVSCTSDTDCIAAFGEAWARCGTATCEYAYVDKEGHHSNSFCSDFGFGPCEQAACATFLPKGGICFALMDRPRLDDGTLKYFATLVVHIPLEAKGRYTIPLMLGETFLYCPLAVTCEIPTPHELGFSVNILTGSCCSNLMADSATCEEGVLRSECGDDETPPFLWRADAPCPPYGQPCPPAGACCDTVHAQCDDFILESDCAGVHQAWTARAACDDVECLADTGACCTRDPFEACNNATTLADCQCATCTWHKFQTCDEIECAVAPIPTVSAWGLAALTLLLMTGAKVAFGRGAEAARVRAA
jgi:hypothetical protein